MTQTVIPPRRSETPAATGLPATCGPLSALVATLLAGGAPVDRVDIATLIADLDRVADPLHDRDFQLALWLCYELHQDGFAGVDPHLEWDPELLRLRGLLEERFEHALRRLVGPLDAAAPLDEVRSLTGSGRAPRLACYLGRDATREQFRDYLSQRALYHLRESDPQSLVLPRLRGAAKAALAELQYDEYGAGRPERLHATLFARALADLGLPTEVSAYVEGAEATMLATVNTMSLFCLHRRLRGAAMGHLAAFEATSSIPCRLVALGAHRLDLPASVADYYEEHVEADAVHEQLAIDDICGAMLAEEPELAEDVVFGAAACLAVDEIAAVEQFARWEEA